VGAISGRAGGTPGERRGRPGKPTRGARAEQTAAAFLRARGLRILASNYRVPQGEIDLIAEDAGTLAFVEVRLRSGDSHGGALESIDRRKRRRILTAARHYLAQLREAEPPCRFDAVLLAPLRESGPERYTVEWLRDAFCADDC